MHQNTHFPSADKAWFTVLDRPSLSSYHQVLSSLAPSVVVMIVSDDTSYVNDTSQHSTCRQNLGMGTVSCCMMQDLKLQNSCASFSKYEHLVVTIAKHGIYVQYYFDDLWNKNLQWKCKITSSMTTWGKSLLVVAVALNVRGHTFILN